LTIPTGCERAEVHGVDFKKMHDPWLNTRNRYILEGQGSAETLLIGLAKFPNNQFVIATMTSRR
jgi:hypothetical protein